MPASDDPELSQREKRSVMLQDADVRSRQGGSTYLDHTHDDTSGGRFAGRTPQTVVGATPVPSYPVGNEWAAGDQNLEPPFPTNVSETPVVGEPHEIETSLEPPPFSGAQGHCGDPAAAAAAAPPPLRPRRAGSPPFSKKGS